MEQVVRSKTLATRTKLCENNHSTFTVPFQQFNLVSFASVIMKFIVASLFLSRGRFPVKLICCIAFWCASSAFCFLKSIGIILQKSLKWL